MKSHLHAVTIPPSELSNYNDFFEGQLMWMLPASRCKTDCLREWGLNPKRTYDQRVVINEIT